jgi:hypothetical protein
MCYHAGMDVSLETANICIVGDAGTSRLLKKRATVEPHSPLEPSNGCLL